MLLESKVKNTQRLSHSRAVALILKVIWRLHHVVAANSTQPNSAATDVRRGSAPRSASGPIGRSPDQGRSPTLGVREAAAGRSPASHQAAKPSREIRVLRQSRVERFAFCGAAESRDSRSAAKPSREIRVLRRSRKASVLSAAGRSPASHQTAEPSSGRPLQ